MQLYSTKKAADWAGVVPQTVIDWEKAGLVKASTRRKPGEARRYTENDVIAMVLLKEAIERKLAPYPASAREIVAMVQRGDAEEMKRAEVRVYQRRAEFGALVWVRDIHDKVYMAEVNRWQKEQGMKLVSTQKLSDMVELHRDAFRAGVRDRIARRVPFEEQEN